MSYVELLYAAPNDLKKMFRDLEKIKRKLFNNINYIDTGPAYI